MRVRALIAVAAVGLFIPLGLAPPASAAPGDPSVAVIHGIADPFFEVVDLYVDDTKFDDVTFKDRTRTTLAPARYAVGIAGPDSTSSADVVPIFSRNFDVFGDTSIVAQVDEIGFPVIESYRDDLTATAVGKARVVVRHAAAADVVSINANGAEVIAALRNGQSQSLEVTAGSYTFEAKSGADSIEGLSATLDLKAGTVYTIYAVGGSFLPELVEVDPDVASKVAELDEELSVEDGVPDEEEWEFPEIPYSLIVDEYKAGEVAPATTATATSRPPIPTAVPAGDGTSGWSGPLGLPALIAITLAAGLAVAAGFSLRRGNATHRR